MKSLRIIALFLACTAVLLLAFGGSGFQSVTAEREVSMHVVDDESAFVGVVACRNSNEKSANGATVVKIRVRNQYATTFDVTEVENQVGSKSLSPGKTRGIEPGETTTFNVVLDDSDTQTVSLHVSNDDFSAVVESDIYSRKGGGDGRCAG
jgi:hypothetical protein